MRSASWRIAVMWCGVAAVGPLAGAAPEPARSKDVYGRVTHLGWVVRDAAATAAAWQRLGVRDVSPPVDERFDVTAPGGPGRVHVKKIVARIGGVRVDWIEPLDAGGPYRAFLDRRGEGVHHLGYTVRDPAVFDNEVRSLAGLGAAAVGTGTLARPTGAVRFAWLDTATPGGMTIELALEPAAEGDAPVSSANDDPFNRVTQFAFAVRDVAAVSRHLERLGFTPLAVEPNVSLDRVYRGNPGVFEMLLGWGRGGAVPFEWIQPTRGPSVYHEYLEAHGEGFHHLGFDVRDMDAALRRLRERGLTVTMAGGWNVNGYEGRFAYLDTERFGGVTIELLWNKPRQ
jgi:hypothetical protein